MKIIAKNYDYLWTVHQQTYLFNSIILTDEFVKRDFLVYSTENFTTFYIAKAARKKLSDQGLIFFKKKYPSYAAKVKKELQFGKAFLKKQKALKLAKISNIELSRKFLRIIAFTQKMFRYYFWTEYFCLDRVAEIIQEQPDTPLGRQLKKRTEQMGKLKYQERALLNTLFFSNKFMTRYFKEIGRRLYLSLNQVNKYHFLELIDLLKEKKVSLPNRSVVVTGLFSSWRDVLGQRAKEIISRFETVDPNTKVIHGQTGNAGFYRGVVKKVDFSLEEEIPAKQIQEMKKGEVLVSGSTGPEMILACKKAGAIVTDEGGITSHAAIVSRELKIPCVIATKIATRVLKDGDLVEVDANKGMVRKI